VGGIDDALDPSRLTASGSRCLEELVYIATLAFEGKISTEWVVVASATAVETHFNRVLESLVDISGIRVNKFGDALLEEIADDIYKSWESRLRWLNRGFGVAIAGDLVMQNYLSLVDLRNALVHGQGELTPLQQRNIVKLLSMKDRLRRTLGIDFRGPAIVMNDSVQKRVVHICREVTMHVDRSVLAAHPSLPA
jgi:hypothetical protein